MPFYEYVGPGGEVIDEFFHMGEAPVSFDRDGATYRRRITAPQISAAVDGVVNQYPYVSRALPRNLTGAKHDKRGHPIIESRRHEREVMAQHGYIRE